MYYDLHRAFNKICFNKVRLYYNTLTLTIMIVLNNKQITCYFINAISRTVICEDMNYICLNCIYCTDMCSTVVTVWTYVHLVGTVWTCRNYVCSVGTVQSYVATVSMWTELSSS